MVTVVFKVLDNGAHGIQQIVVHQQRIESVEDVEVIVASLANFVLLCEHRPPSLPYCSGYEVHAASFPPLQLRSLGIVVFRFCGLVPLLKKSRFRGRTNRHEKDNALAAFSSTCEKEEEEDDFVGFKNPNLANIRAQAGVKNPFVGREIEPLKQEIAKLNK